MPNMQIEYYPWSSSVLSDCLREMQQGKIPTLDLELTAKCSGASCIYCDSKPDVCQEGQRGELDFPTLRKVILEAKEMGLKWVYTCGLGEPLEDPNFWKTIELLKENGISLSMFSNGVFIKNRAVARRLKEHDVSIILKMDTFNESNFDKILGKQGVARRIYAARDYLLSEGYGADSEGHTNLAFSIVPTTLSIDGIDEVVDFCKKHGIFASIGELEQAGEVIKNNLTETLGISREQILHLKAIADRYISGSYMRPICPCILTGLHIDNLGNCVVDENTGLNCKWFLLQNPRIVRLGNVRNCSVKELYRRATEYRTVAFASRRDSIMESCSISYVFGGCGGNPKDIIDLALKNYG